MDLKALLKHETLNQPVGFLRGRNWKWGKKIAFQGQSFQNEATQVEYLNMSLGA